MADTIQLFLTSSSLEAAAVAIEACLGQRGDRTEPGRVDFPQVDFYPRLRPHSYVDDDDLDFTSFPLVLTAKNYGEPETRDPEDSDTVRWFRRLFDCLRGQQAGRLLLAYNLESVLARFDPGEPPES